MLIQMIANWLNFGSFLVPSLDSKNFKISQYCNYFRNLLIIDPNLTRQNKLINLVIDDLANDELVPYLNILLLTQENLMKTEIISSTTKIPLGSHFNKVFNNDQINFLLKANPFFYLNKLTIKLDERNLYTTFLEIQAFESTEIINIDSSLLIIIDGNQISQKNLCQILVDLHHNFQELKYAKLLVCVDTPQVVEEIIDDFQYVFMGNSKDIDYQNSLQKLLKPKLQYYLSKLFNTSKADYLYFMNYR